MVFIRYFHDSTPYLFIFYSCDDTDSVTGVLFGHHRYSSINSDKNEIESWKGRHCDREQPDRTQLGLLSLNHELAEFELTLTFTPGEGKG